MDMSNGVVTAESNAVAREVLGLGTGLWSWSDTAYDSVRNTREGSSSGKARLERDTLGGTSHWKLIAGPPSLIERTAPPPVLETSILKVNGVRFSLR